MQIKQLHKTLEDMRSTRHLMNRRGINNFFIFCPKSPIVFQNNFYQVESLFPVFYLITLLRVWWEWLSRSLNKVVFYKWETCHDCFQRSPLCFYDIAIILVIICLYILYCIYTGFLRRFRNPMLVPRISNRVPKIRENYHRVPKIRKNLALRIREIGSLQIQTEFLTFSLKKPWYIYSKVDESRFCWSKTNDIFSQLLLIANNTTLLLLYHMLFSLYCMYSCEIFCIHIFRKDWNLCRYQIRSGHNMQKP